MNKTTKTILWLIVAIVVIGGIWYGVSKKPVGLHVIKVGVLTPLTGPAAFYGENIIKGIEIVKDLINEKGGINGAQISLVEEDSKCEGVSAMTAANKLSDFDKVVGIIGEACSAAAMPLSPIAKNKNFVLIAAAASNPELTKNPFVFRVNPNDLTQAQGITEYLVDKGIKNIAILALNDEYGQGLVAEFNKNFSALNGNIAQTEWFASEATDFKVQIAKLSSSFEMLFIIAAPAQHPLIAKQLVELGKNWPRIAEFNFSTVSDESANVSMNGTLYPIVSFDENATENAKLLQQKMQEKYNTQPDIVTAWGFDSLYVLAESAKKCPKAQVTAECINQNLIGLSFEGASGKNKITDKGEIENPPFEFVEYQILTK